MFKKQHTFEERFIESKRVLEKYPHRIPIICEKCNNQKDLPDIDKIKYLVPSDMTIGQFMFIIRKRIAINPEEALFLLVGNTITSSSMTIGYVYNFHKDPDGYLYIQYAKENTFGLGLGFT